MTKRKIYFVSDGTGITVEALGQSLLTQFSSLDYTAKKLPYINTVDKAKKLIENIKEENKNSTHRPIILSTLISKEIRSYLDNQDIFVLDLFEKYIDPLEKELQIKSNHTIGKSHSLKDIMRYDARMEAINFTLNTDDGLAQKKYDEAELILLGISRCGKTPTCLYLAIQYGIKAANYPLVEEDLESHKLPDILTNYRDKLYGLSIDPKRLHAIRFKRRPNSNYANLQNCKLEVKSAEKLFIHENIPFLYTTTHSIEEIATNILEEKNLGNIL